MAIDPASEFIHNTIYILEQALADLDTIAIKLEEIMT